ncbi:transcriptional regulatory protein DegU [Collibacillus ludicampi]|uniref:Transcriptional regulatory protein DegU n=1 Tax=Collibacillus ludicampi TaxID=2771369 RepID=A0AAV4LCT7_9BACL|nr:response regulator transcription factor [Collibacillus ludicampi]GIM45570.1 transcriptional regulatory protein DegU [Collibacillus ludicampi]
MKHDPIKILLADDHTLFRQGLRRIFALEDDLEVVGEAGDGEVVVELADALMPHVIIMDINMPKKNGVEATRAIKQLNPELKVLILSIHDDEEYVFETIRVGANGYLLKDVDSESLLDAVRKTVEGASFIHPKVTTKLLEEFKRLSRQAAEMESQRTMEREEDACLHFSLTQRESEILKLMAEGKSNRTIGEVLYISEKTVKNHVSSILCKLGVDDRTQAVIMAAKNGLVKL